MANLIIWTCINERNNVVRTLGPVHIQHWLRKHGYTVKIVDFCHLMSTADLVSITERHTDKDTIAIGCSTTFWLPLIHTIMQPLKHLEGFVVPPLEFNEPKWVIDARELLESRHHKLKWILGGATPPNREGSFRKDRFEWTKFTGYAEDEVLKFMDEQTSIVIC